MEEILPLLQDCNYNQQDVTTIKGEKVKAIFTDKNVVTNNLWQKTDLRSSYYLLNEQQYLTAGKCSQILYWDRNSQYCPHCGTMTLQRDVIMKKCPKCNYEIYPPIATAIIVLIHKGKDEILMVRALNFKGTFYGLVAGFLEPGETLEQCVHREVREETGLEIENIRYFGSQSWPYPCGLMVGFNADYKSGEIKIQESELSTAQFFHRSNLPELPKKMSIARRLVDNWLIS